MGTARTYGVQAPVKGMNQLIKKVQNLALAASLVFGMAVAAVPTPKANAAAAGAVTAAFTTGAKVSFTFDDGLLSHHELAAPVLAKYGFPGVAYVTTDCVGMTTTPNGCAADGTHPYMTWAQIAELQNNFGWEIGSHTKSHPQLATDRQNNVITAQQMVEEIEGSQTILKENDNTGLNFADPFGDYDNTSVAAIAKKYTSHRGFHDIAENTFPYNDYLLTVRQIQGNVSLDTIKGYINTAKASGQWLVLVFHEITAGQGSASTALDDYQYSDYDLDQIAAYVQAQQVPVTDIAHGLANSSTNALGDGTFTNGITGGWTTDTPATIAADANNNGSLDGSVAGTGATYSVAVNGTGHLFSPLTSVSQQQYVVKSYVNVTSTSGEIAFYIDEYNAAGEDLGSGKYYPGIIGTTTANALQVKNINFLYTPSSANVAKIRMQVIANGATTKAFVDNVQMFAVGDINGKLPVPSGVVTPPTGKTGDINGDGAIDALDLSTLLGNWNKTGMTKAQGDLNADGVIDALDLSTLLANWGK